MKQVKTVFLLTLLSGILLLFGFFLGGEVGLIIALILAVVMNFGSYWFSDRIALRMSGAKEVTPEEEPRLHEVVDRVISMSGMKKPRVYVIPNDSPNAFATGRNEAHAAVAATTGIMRILDDRELTAVFGHEMGHIRNKDILVSAIVATIAAAIMFLAMMGRFAMIFGGGRDRNGGIIGLVAMLAMLILAPIAASMVRMAVSRDREYGADRTGAEITHDPLALASALQKLQDYSAVKPMNVNPAMSHLFIVNPLGKVDFASLFSSHPPTDKRIERLNEMARRGL